MGHALHRNHLVRRPRGLAARPSTPSPPCWTTWPRAPRPLDVPGLCWWDGTPSLANTETRRTVAPADIPSPDYDQWQAALDASPVQEHIHPKLVVEGARGCWWGRSTTAPSAG
ncbi:hypothetical protein LT493_30010 [Streptomyces tricolor]|nr:hypothetical protein [Streptomyces tricolor]